MLLQYVWSVAILAQVSLVPAVVSIFVIANRSCHSWPSAMDVDYLNVAFGLGLPSEVRGAHGTYVRVEAADRIIYNYEPERYGVLHAYAFEVGLKGHRFCMCDRSRKSKFVMLHHRSMGPWPMHYLVLDMLAQDLVRVVGDLFERRCDPSYVLWHPSMSG